MIYIKVFLIFATMLQSCIWIYMLSELRKIRIELQHNDLNQMLSDHKKQMINYHYAQYDNIIDQMPSRSFIAEILQERDKNTNQSQTLSKEARRERYERLEKAFTAPSIKKEYKEYIEDVETRS